MRCWDHGDGLAGDVDAQFHAPLQDIGEMLPQKRRALVGNIQIHTVQTMFLHLEIDRTCHHVTGRQFGTRVMREHETRPSRARGQQQATALSPDGLRDQERLGVRVVQTSGVKLDELHIAHTTSRPPGRSNTVSRGGVWIGRVKIDFPCSTGSQNRVRRTKGEYFPAVHIQHISPMAMVSWPFEMPISNDIHQHVVLKNTDRGRRLHLSNQGLLDRGTRRIGDMHNAPLTVAALARQMQLTRFVTVTGELHPHGSQPGNRCRSPFYYRTGRFEIAQAGACSQRIADMLLQRIAFAQDGRHAPLRPAAGAVGEFALGDNCDPPTAREQQGCRQPRQSASDNDDVKIVLHYLLAD